MPELELDDIIDFLPEELSETMHNLFSLKIAKKAAPEFNVVWSDEQEKRLQDSIRITKSTALRLGVRTIEMKIVKVDGSIHVGKFLTDNLDKM